MTFQSAPPVILLGARPALPFVLQTPSPIVQDQDLFRFIFDRLDRLQDLSARSQAELTSLRALNIEILEAVTQRLSSPGTEVLKMTPPASSKLTLRLMGSFETRVGDRLLSSWPGRKARLLLAYLAMEKGRMAPRDVLIELFWPGTREERGANNLSIAIYQIRSRLMELLPDAGKAIVVRQGLYGLDPELVEVDLWELRAAMEAARHALEQKDHVAVKDHLLNALGLCRGELLASDPYEEWTAEPRRTLNAAWQKALNWLAEEACSRQDWTGALDFGTQMLQRDACDESAHRLVMSAHLKMGNRSQALRQYLSCVETLREELGVEPSLETRRAGESLSR
jgi:DNA-binding SARP family transcriptional activator